MLKLSEVTLYASAAAGTGTAYGVDWQNGEVQTRRIVTVLADAADSIAIEGTLDGTTWFNIATHTGATTPYVDTLTGPYKQIRAVKTGAAGLATVVGLI